MRSLTEIRVLVVDDSVTIRAMIEVLIEREPDMILVGVAANAQDAERMIATLYPDVVTLDIAMPGLDGLSLLDRVKAQTRVLMLSSQNESVQAALDRGAYGFFCKSRITRHARELIRLIRAAAAGRVSRKLGHDPVPA